MNEIQNNNQFDFLSDEQLLALLDAQGAGKDFVTACREAAIEGLSEDDSLELKALWDIGTELHSWKDTIVPPPPVLDRALLSTPMITNFSASFPAHEQASMNGVETPFSLATPYQLFLREKWKVGAPFAAFFLIVAVTFAMKSPSSRPAPLAIATPPYELSGKEVRTMEAASSLPRVALHDSEMQDTLAFNESHNAETQTAPLDKEMAKSVSFTEDSVNEENNVDEMVLALSVEADADAEFLTQIDEDMTLLALENETMGSMGTTYNEEQM